MAIIDKPDISLGGIDKPDTPVIAGTCLTVDPVEGATVYRLYSVRNSTTPDAEYYDGSYTITEDGGTE